MLPEDALSMLEVISVRHRLVDGFGPPLLVPRRNLLLLDSDIDPVEVPCIIDRVLGEAVDQLRNSLNSDR